MQKRIQPYKLKGVNKETLPLPKGAVIVNAMDVNGEAVIHALVDMDTLDKEDRIIHRVQTGFPTPENIQEFIYIGSFTVANYGVVYHFYEEVIVPVTFRASGVREATAEEIMAELILNSGKSEKPVQPHGQAEVSWGPEDSVAPEEEEIVETLRKKKSTRRVSDENPLAE